MKHITDRKERTDPLIPTDLSQIQPKVNGLVNGHSHHRSPSSKMGTPTVKYSPKPQRDIPFADTPAIVRTASGMSTFVQLDREMNRLDSGKLANSSLAERLRDFISPVEDESESDAGSSEDGSIAMDGEVGGKRKLFVSPVYRTTLEAHE